MGCDLMGTIEYGEFGDPLYHSSKYFAKPLLSGGWDHRQVYPFISKYSHEGLPEQVSFSVEREVKIIEDVTWHWIDTEGFSKAIQEYEEQSGEKALEEFHAVIAAMKKLTNARLVYWYSV